MKRDLIDSSLIAISLLIASPIATWADWNPGDPYKMHYPQLPDLTTHGLDVLAGPVQPTGPVTPGQQIETFLADDWLCTSTGPVTDIHIWGSYRGDVTLLPPQDTSFSLVIFSNVPAGVDRPYSHPGQPLWSAYIKPTATRIYATAQEQFYDPIAGGIAGSDTQVWQFNFDIPELTAFQQTSGNIYWLGVHHTFDLGGNAFVSGDDLAILALRSPGAFGWKTSGSQHFEDDAVWISANTFEFGQTKVPHFVPTANEPWKDLHHPITGESLDLSFVITTKVPEPTSLVLLVIAAAGTVLFSRRRA